MIILIILLLLPYFTLSNDGTPEGPDKERTKIDALSSQSTPPIVNSSSQPETSSDAYQDFAAKMAKEALANSANANPLLIDFGKTIKGLNALPDGNTILLAMAEMVKQQSMIPSTNESASNAQTAENNAANSERLAKEFIPTMDNEPIQNGDSTKSPQTLMLARPTGEVKLKIIEPGQQFPLQTSFSGNSYDKSLDGTKFQKPTPVKNVKDTTDERQLFSVQSSQPGSIKSSNSQSDATVHIKSPECVMSTVFPFDRNLQVVAARTTVNFLSTQKNIRGCALVVPQEHEILKDMVKNVPWDLCSHIFVDVKYKMLKKNKFEFGLDSKLHKIAKEIKYEHPKIKIIVKLLPESDADINCLVIGDTKTKATARKRLSANTMDWIERTSLRMDKKDKEEYLTDRGKAVNDTGKAKLYFDGVMLQYANVHPKDTQGTHAQTNYFSDLVHIFSDHMKKRKFLLNLHVKFAAFDDLHPEMNLDIINDCSDYIFLDSTLLIPYSFETSAKSNLIAALEHLKFAGFDSKKLYIGLPLIATEHQLHGNVNAGSTEMKNMLTEAHASMYTASAPKTIPYTTYCELEESVGKHAKRKPESTTVYFGNSVDELEKKIDFVIKYGLAGVYMDLSWEIIKQLAQKTSVGTKKESKCEILSQIQSESSRKLTSSTNTDSQNPGQNETISNQNKSTGAVKTTKSSEDCSVRAVMDLINCRFVGNQEHTNKINETTFATLVAQSKVCYIMFQRAGTSIGDSRNKGMTCALAPKTPLVATSHLSSKSTEHQTTVPV
ncbi:hypothetical protein Ddc_02901 [Ditylenchus destructor]|nr:hypothetical protein Ddc_02901 [Ditylenchus destructor]